MRSATFTALATTVLGLSAAAIVQAATDLHYSAFTLGTGQQTIYAPTNAISGTMTTTVPRFNGGLGTLIQADFEYAANTNSAWQANSGTGTVSINLSGPADVGGQPMGTLTSGTSGPINDQTPIPYGGVGFVNATFTSGAFFNSLTGVGSETLTWLYSGTSTISTPAIGTFDWGGSAHVLYTYEPVPEPASLGLLVAGAVLMLRRRNRVAWNDTGANRKRDRNRKSVSRERALLFLG